MATRQRNEVFVRLRKAAGWTQKQLITEYVAAAQRLGVRGTVTERTVARWESTDPPCPAPAQQQVLEALFGVPLEDMGFEVPEHRRVDRRWFLTEVGALSAVSLVHTPEQQPVRVAAGDLRRLDESVEQVYLTDHSRGSQDAYALAEQVTSRITNMLSTGSYLAAVGARLQATLGATTAHMGWLMFDAAQLAAARSHCLESLALARLNSDRHLEARALATLSLIAVEQGRAWEADSATQAAWSTAGRFAGSTVRALLCARQAGALCATGDLTGARRALSMATSNLERADHDDPPRFAVFFGLAELDQATASYYVAAGRPDAAAAFLRSTVRALGDGYARNTALYRAKLAAVLLAAGELDEAAAEAVSAAQGLAASSSAQGVAVLHQVRDGLADSGDRGAIDAAQRVTLLLDRSAS